MSWTINTATIGWLTEQLGLKGINFNLKEFLYYYDTKGASSYTRQATNILLRIVILFVILIVCI